MFNKTEINQLISQYGIKPSKSKGQNFLIDQNSLAKIVEAANLSANDYVLEIGPGLGVLTEELIKKAGQVLAVELDAQIITFLYKKFKQVNNLQILESDILKLKNSVLAEKLKSEKYKVVANLPYNITKPILRKFLSYDPKPKLIVVLVQKEVALKIVAQNKKQSILGLSVLFYGQPEIIDYVPASSFYPQPKVDSAILKIKTRTSWPAELQQVLTKPEVADFSEKIFWQIIKIGFSSPRKQIQNNLQSGFKFSKQEVFEKIEQTGIKPSSRAEDLSLREWFLIYQQFK